MRKGKINVQDNDASYNLTEEGFINDKDYVVPDVKIVSEEAFKA